LALDRDHPPGPAEKGPPGLRRRLSLPLVTLYGLGTTVGAGIFVLVGKVAGSAGMYAPAAFLVASLLAALTAVSFAELTARIPKSAGEALYVHAGLGRRWLAVLVGLMVIAAAVVSSATIVTGAAGYARTLLPLPPWLMVGALVLLLAGVAGWGIAESVTLASLVTVAEIGLLVVVIAGGAGAFATLPARLPELVPPLEGLVWVGILSGAILAFYAYLGFEDMVNLAEEVTDVRRTLPAGIFLTLVVTTLLYLALATLAVLAVPQAELAASEAPLALIFERTAGVSAPAFNLVVSLAVINGALIQIIMAARVLYGLGREGWLSPALGRVNPRTRTPLVATAVVAAVILALALAFPLVALAKIASTVTLTIFALVNLSLYRIKRRDPRPAGLRVYPAAIPLTGFTVSAGFVLFQLARFAGW